MLLYNSKRSYVLKNFQNYFHAKAFQKGLSRSFLTTFKVSAIFLIISFFLICVYYVLSVLHVSYLYACFVNISAYIPAEILTRSLYLFYTNSFIFIFVDFKVIEYAIHSDSFICNSFINYKVLPAFDFHSIGLEFSQLLQTDLAPERKCCDNYCFSLVLFIFPIMIARVFLRNKHKRVKAFSGCIIFLLTITKPNLLTKSDILKSTSEIFTFELLMHAICCTHLIFIILSYSLRYQNLSTEIKTPSLNCCCYFRVISV